MYTMIEEKRAEIQRLCQRYHVRRLELFGSATGAGFNPQTSDVDFLVEFEEMTPAAYAEAYFGLLEKLGDLFQRPVDLVVLSAVKNPYLLKGIEYNRTLLYAA